MTARFDWDPAKDRLNQKRHGLSFEFALEVFDDPFNQTFFDRTKDGEDRYWTVGRLGNLVVIVVVHTLPGEFEEEVIRIISARKATPRERRFYEEGAS